jgi:hypothetical protein
LSKAVKISIIAAIVVLFVVLLYYFGREEPEGTYVSDNWTETYDPADKGPYGTYMLKELLDTAGLFGEFLEINQDLPDVMEDDPDVNDIYFFVGLTNYLNENSTDFLYEFIGKGNTVFMACESFPYGFLSPFSSPDSIVHAEGVLDSIQHFKFTNADLASKRYTSTYVYNNKIATRNWYYFDTTRVDLYGEDTMVVLGSNTKNEPNFIKIKYGEGLIFLHTTPYLFTNISLMKRDGFQYAEKILKHIPPGRIQWDKYNLNFRWDNGDGGGDGTGGDEKRESMLQFILANPPLLWSMIILLAGGILYAVFKGKRMQKVIPAAELKENTSLGYITTLSSLYMQENKHHKLIRLKEKTFLNFIAEHYYISCKTPDEKFFEKVAVKSQVEKEKIAGIFTAFRRLEAVQDVTDEELILLHQKIEYFYKKCR